MIIKDFFKYFTQEYSGELFFVYPHQPPKNMDVFLLQNLVTFCSQIFVVFSGKNHAILEKKNKRKKSIFHFSEKKLLYFFLKRQNFCRFYKNSNLFIWLLSLLSTNKSFFNEIWTNYFTGEKCNLVKDTIANEMKLGATEVISFLLDFFLFEVREIVFFYSLPPSVKGKKTKKKGVFFYCRI